MNGSKTRGRRKTEPPDVPQCYPSWVALSPTSLSRADNSSRSGFLSELERQFE